MNKKFQFLLKITLGLLIGIFLVNYLVSSVNYKNVLHYINNVKWEYFVICIFFSFFSNVLRALRWAVLLEDSGYKVSRIGLICGTFFGFFINLLIPRGGELARSTSMTYKYGLPTDKLLGTILLERVIDFIMLLILILLVVIVNFQLFGYFFAEKLHFLIETLLSSWKIVGLLLVIGILVVFMLIRLKYKFSFIKKVVNFFNGVVDGLKSVKQLKRRAIFIFYTIGIWLFYVLMTYVPFYAFTDLENLGLINAVFVLILGGIGMIIPTPGGLGSYHVVVVEGITSVLEISREVSTAYAFTSHSLITLYTLFVGLFCAIFIFKGRRYM
jgi:glycosyltransferase 2 family protein